MQGLPFDRPPDPVETESQDLFLDRQRNTPDGTDPCLACFERVGSCLCAPHNIHHRGPHCRKVKMEVQTLLGPGSGTLYPGNRDRRAVCGEDGPQRC